MARLTVAVYEGSNEKTLRWTRSFAQGAARHGANVRFGPYRPEVVEGADLHVFWALRAREVIAHCVRAGEPFVCVDHGFTADRMDFTSLNLNGLNGKSELDVSSFADDASRCVEHGWRVEPRRDGSPGIEVVVGQVHNDMSLEGNDVYAWADAKSRQLLQAGAAEVVFRPHPREKPEAAERWKTVLARSCRRPLEELFARGARFHTFSSTTAVAAELAGLSAEAHSPMSMAWRLQHGMDRQRWLNDISWRQYSLGELASGLAWEVVSGLALGRAPRGRPGETCPYRLPDGSVALEAAKEAA